MQRSIGSEGILLRKTYFAEYESGANQVDCYARNECISGMVMPVATNALGLPELAELPILRVIVPTLVRDLSVTALQRGR